MAAAGVTAGAATGTGTGRKILVAGKAETDIFKIDFDGFDHIQKLGVYDVFESTDVECRVIFFWLIQGHCKGWTASPALV